MVHIGSFYGMDEYSPCIVETVQRSFKKKPSSFGPQRDTGSLFSRWMHQRLTFVI